MYGAIVGDLAGSIYEFDQLKKVHRVQMNNLIEDNAFYSDDTILTIAILDAILNNKDYDYYLRKYIQEYSKYKPDFNPYFKTSFSPNLIKWSKSNVIGTSHGNGAMMRISPVGYMFDSEKEVIENARFATIPSHNSNEAIDSATMVALIIYYSRKGYTKDEILEGYLNTINYGQGNFGIGNASRYYFNKDPIDLTLEESLILAGIPNSPENYNPVANYDLAIKRALIVAQSMVLNGYLSQEEYDSLFQDEISIYGKSSLENLDMLMYYQDAVIEELKSIHTIPEELLQAGGIKIYTYLDLDAQKDLEENILSYLSNSDLQSASVVIDPDTGGVIALSGGVSYAESQYNRATQAKRQVGSTMKPFLYYGALEEGMTSASTFNSQYTTFTLSNGDIYSPKNYGSIYANKEITMAEAIAVSDNVYAVKTNMFLGASKLVETASKVGIEAQLEPVASLALGTKEMSVLDLARGYTTFATGGYKEDIGFIRKIVDSEGNILYEKEEAKELVLNMNYNYILTEMLTGTTNSRFKDYANPTALTIASKLSRKYAIKTGTTDTDFWIAGYNPDIVMVTWVGMDDNSPLSASDSYISKNIWAETVEDILADTEEHWYETPLNVVGVVLDAVSGIPTNDTSKATLYYFVKGTEDVIQTEYVSKEEEIEE